MAASHGDELSPAAPKLVDRVLVPIEGGSEELLVQQWAVGLADALGARLHAVHVSTDGLDPPEDVFSYVSRLAQDHALSLETTVVNAKTVVDELVEELSPNDLVVIGTRVLGTGPEVSVTEELIQRAPCPVQVIRIE